MHGAVASRSRLSSLSTVIDMISSTKQSALAQGSSVRFTLRDLAGAYGMSLGKGLGIGIFLTYSERTTSGSQDVHASRSFMVSVMMSEMRQKSDGHGEHQKAIEGKLKYKTSHSILHELTFGVMFVHLDACADRQT